MEQIIDLIHVAGKLYFWLTIAFVIVMALFLLGIAGQKMKTGGNMNFKFNLDFRMFLKIFLFVLSWYITFKWI